PNQTSRTVYFQHYIVTGINTSRTVYTFQLCPIPDINSSGTHLNTKGTVYTISFCLSLSRFLILFDFSSGLTPKPIIDYHNGILVEQHSLQSSIGTNHGASLLSQKCEDTIKCSRKSK